MTQITSFLPYQMFHLLSHFFFYLYTLDDLSYIFPIPNYVFLEL